MIIDIIKEPKRFGLTQEQVENLKGQLQKRDILIENPDKHSIAYEMMMRGCKRGRLRRQSMVNFIFHRLIANNYQKHKRIR